jgi:hypothetical protein
MQRIVKIKGEKVKSELAKCKRCGGAGKLFESFQPDRTCPDCSGNGFPLPLAPMTHTQIIHFVGGYKRTIREIVSVWENECIHIMTKSGIEWVINKKNVLCCEKIRP